MTMSRDLHQLCLLYQKGKVDKEGKFKCLVEAARDMLSGMPPVLDFCPRNQIFRTCGMHIIAHIHHGSLQVAKLLNH